MTFLRTPLFVSLIFQFHYGAIGSGYTPALDQAYTPISIPLWCDWELAAAKIMGIPAIFQFHYGAIGSIKTTWNCYPLPKFQFHYGAIGSFRAGFVIKPLYAFQFHYGAIGSRFCSVSIYREFISIPLWCDWEGLKYNALPHPARHFNSTMVRLGVQLYPPHQPHIF